MMLTFALAWVFPAKAVLRDGGALRPAYTATWGTLPTGGTIVVHQRECLFLNGGPASESGRWGYKSCVAPLAGFVTETAVRYKAEAALDYLIITLGPNETWEENSCYMMAHHGLLATPPGLAVTKMEPRTLTMNGSAVAGAQLMSGLFGDLYIFSCFQGEGEIIPDSMCLYRTALPAFIQGDPIIASTPPFDDQVASLCRDVPVDWVSILTLCGTTLTLSGLLVKWGLFVYQRRTRKAPDALSTSLINGTG